MQKMRSCPFCGSVKLKLTRASERIGYNGLDIPVYRVGFYVRCQVCHARGGRVSGKVLAYDPPDGLGLPSWASSEDDLAWSAVDAWNMRKWSVDECTVEEYISRWEEEKGGILNERKG